MLQELERAKSGACGEDRLFRETPPSPSALDHAERTLLGPSSRLNALRYAVSKEGWDIEDFGIGSPSTGPRGYRVDLAADDEDRRGIAERPTASLEREAHATFARGQMVAPLARCLFARTACVVPERSRLLRRSVRDAFMRSRARRPARGSRLSAEIATWCFTTAPRLDSSANRDTLALSLDPYPRSAAAEAALREAGVLSEEEAGPFAVLAKLKRHLSE